MSHTGRRPSRLEPAQPTSVESAAEPSGPAAAVALASRTTAFGELLTVPIEAQQARGYFHTLREICQQPTTWRRTASQMTAQGDILGRFLRDAQNAGQRRPILLTGSGSSLYGAETLGWWLQEVLSRPVVPVAGGDLLTHGLGHLPVSEPGLMISLGRSGNSPESSAAIDVLLEREPACRHLIITCNQRGRLALRYDGQPHVRAVVLDDETCDRSLVMTSSLTNMLVAGRFVGRLGSPDAYRAEIDRLAAAATRVLLEEAEVLARVGRLGLRSAIVLGSGARSGTAREVSLKILETTAGRIPTFAETYLGIRHGPMSAVREGTLLLCLLSSDPVARAYEVDLIREVNHKALPGLKVIVGEGIPGGLLSADDVAIDLAGGEPVSDADLAVLGIVVGQLLAFFMAMHLGCEPDRPSTNGAISRVVPEFAIHPRG